VDQTTCAAHGTVDVNPTSVPTSRNDLARQILAHEHRYSAAAVHWAREELDSAA
jgi:hypothetical protein